MVCTPEMSTNFMTGPSYPLTQAIVLVSDLEGVANTRIRGRAHSSHTQFTPAYTFRQRACGMARHGLPLPSLKHSSMSRHACPSESIVRPSSHEHWNVPSWFVHHCSQRGVKISVAFDGMSARQSLLKAPGPHHMRSHSLMSSQCVRLPLMSP